MHFEVRPKWPNGDDHSYADEYAVFGYEPMAGNDAALIAVFNHPIAAYSLADVLNFASAQESQARADRERVARAMQIKQGALKAVDKDWYPNKYPDM